MVTGFDNFVVFKLISLYRYAYCQILKDASAAYEAHVRSLGQTAASGGVVGGGPQGSDEPSLQATQAPAQGHPPSIQLDPSTQVPQPSHQLQVC